MRPRTADRCTHPLGLDTLAVRPAVPQELEQYFETNRRLDARRESGRAAHSAKVANLRDAATSLRRYKLSSTLNHVVERLVYMGGWP